MKINEIKNKPSVRGSIINLEVGEKKRFLRSTCKVLSVRATAYALSVDTGKKFTVNITKKTITVTRIS